MPPIPMLAGVPSEVSGMLTVMARKGKFKRGRKTAQLYSNSV